MVVVRTACEVLIFLAIAAITMLTAPIGAILWLGATGVSVLAVATGTTAFLVIFIRHRARARSRAVESPWSMGPSPVASRLAASVKKSTLRNEQGQSIIELSFALPILLVLVLGIVDLGFGLRSWIGVTNSAREGARVGAIRGSCAEIQDQVMRTSGGLITRADQITITPSDCKYASGDSISVSVTYDYELVTPLGGMLGFLGDDLFPGHLTMISVSEMRVE